MSCGTASRRQPLQSSIAEPSLEDQISVQARNIASLQDSYRDSSGAVTDAGILREIECLKATLRILWKLRREVRKLRRAQAAS